VMTMPGAFAKGTTAAMLTYVRDHVYETDQHFQKYVAEQLSSRN